MDEIKHWLDIISSLIICTVVSFFTWLDIQLPHITMWVSFISITLSAAWWCHRWYKFFTQKKHE